MSDTHWPQCPNDRIGPIPSLGDAIRERTAREKQAYTDGLREAVKIFKQHGDNAIPILEAAIRISRG